MKISLVNGKAKTLNFLESSFTYHEAPADEARRIYRSCVDPETGEPDAIEAGNRLIEKFVTGWSGVLDANGEEAPFDVALLRPGLPMQVKVRLENAISVYYAEAEQGKDD